MTTDHNEAMRLAGELVAPIGTQTSYQTAHEAAALLRKQAERIAELERLSTGLSTVYNEAMDSLRIAVDERDTLRAEVERLKPNAERYEWLRDNHESDWAICEWQDDPDGLGYYRDARLPSIVDTAIDTARKATQ